MTTRNKISKQSWFLYNAEDKILGRLASAIVNKLTGKDTINYTQNRANNAIVVVINVGKIKVTGDKLNKKYYYRHSGYPGGIKSIKLSDSLKNDPTFVLRNAVKGMLPKNKLQKIYLKNLKMYVDDVHPHSQLKRG